MTHPGFAAGWVMVFFGSVSEPGADMRLRGDDAVLTVAGQRSNFEAKKEIESICRMVRCAKVPVL